MGALLFRRPPRAAAVFKNTACKFGHSFEANSQTPELNFGPHGGAPAGNGIVYSRSLFDRANMILGAPFTVIGNKGVSGETSAQILARFGTALALNPGWIYLDCYSNDPFNGVDTATSIANTLAMINAAKAAGIAVILALDIPRGSAVQMTQAILDQFMAYQHYFEDYARQTTGLLVFNPWPYYVDTASYTTSVQGTPLAAYINADTIHPVAAGAGAAAVGLAALLKPFIPARAHRLGTNSSSTGTGDTINVFKNPLAVQGSGGFWGAGGSGTNPQDWWGQRVVGSALTGVGAIVTRASVAATFPGLFDDGLPGNLVRVALANAVAATEEFAIGVRPYDTGASPLVAGSGPWFYEVEVGMEASSGTINTLQAAATFKTSGPDYLITTNYNADAGEYLGLTKFQGVMRSRNFYLPPTFAGASSTNSLYIRAGTSVGGAANLYIGRPTLRKAQV